MLPIITFSLVLYIVFDKFIYPRFKDELEVNLEPYLTDIFSEVDSLVEEFKNSKIVDIFREAIIKVLSETNINLSPFNLDRMVEIIDKKYSPIKAEEKKNLLKFDKKF